MIMVPVSHLLLRSIELDHRSAYTRRTIHNTNLHAYIIKRTIQAKLILLQVGVFSKGVLFTSQSFFLIIINSDYLNTMKVGLDL